MNQQQKKKGWITLVAIFVILLLLNILSSTWHKRVDVTSEKRFSLSEPTKKLLKNLKDIVVVEVYLEGSFPAGFQKLNEATRDVLNEFKEYGGNKVRFTFVNPLEGKTEEEKKKVFATLAEKGINPVNLQIQRDEDDGYSEKIIFPAAKISYNQKEIPISLLENHLSMSPSEKLNYAESMLEYKFASAIKHMMEPDKKKIAYIVGHGEIIGINTIDILSSLETYYDVDTLDLTRNIEISKLYSAAIICGPSVAFDEKEKFKIDQYVMQGGHMLWFVDQLRIEIDSLRNSNATMALDYALNLDDLLFKYGARINPDLIEDYQQANPIPITVGNIGDQPDIRLLPWMYYPFSIPTSKHPIVNNMDAVALMMANSIDTVGDPSIKKTVLLTTSNRSRRVPAPVRISLAALQFKPTPDMFKEKDIPVAVLLEGKFSSVYANRVDPIFLKVYTDSLKKDYLTTCENSNKMIIVSDANVMTNDFNKTRGPLECGYYKYTEQLFANKTFVLNCMEYLTDDYGLLEARNKNLPLRLLDKAKIKSQRLQWQLVNIALPICLMLVFASGYSFFRKKKYEGKVN
ncbi:MAG: gliding motility-associated ABC transporter substrate-binding protein GldG [Chitinophagaceae bacterium]|nr:gliding motility-associated ABC transporter substrate-binding protein GldG [Chitinophagaceae bacterium]